MRKIFSFNCRQQKHGTLNVNKSWHSSNQLNIVFGESGEQTQYIQVNDKQNISDDQKIRQTNAAPINQRNLCVYIVPTVIIIKANMPMKSLIYL